MVGMKGKSGRHKKDCSCGGCVERKAKKLAIPTQETEPIQETEKTETE